MALEMTSKVETDQQKFVTGQLGNRVESNLVWCLAGNRLNQQDPADIEFES